MPLCTPEYLRELADNRAQRAQAGHRNGLRDAADEIDRLRAGIKILRQYAAKGFRGDTNESDALCNINNYAIALLDTDEQNGSEDKP